MGKKSINFWHSAFFIVQLSHPYMTTGKTIALTRRTFVSKVMSLQMEAKSLTKTNKQQQKHPPYFAIMISFYFRETE